ncbi:MAG: CoA transferase [Pseudomonadales bacterium]|nr:CoA transferase [Pseudomonadales bacterium]
MARAFEDITVIDFSQVLAGPVATQQLAFLGANVIKVETPETGESGRYIRAATDPSPEGMGAIYLSANAGKRSITIDLKHPAAKQLLTTMIEQADVIVQNFKSGVIDRLGFGYKAMSAINPGLIYCSISGYGQHGPRANAAAYDPAVQGASGMMQLIGTDTSGPLRTGFPLVDMTTGLNAAIAISGALYRRKVSGKGQFIDVAMLDCAMSLLSPSYMAYMRSGIEPALLGNQSQLRVPTADAFPTADGYIQITAFSDNQVTALCTVLGIADILKQPRFSTQQHRTNNLKAMQALLTEAFKADTALEWERRMGEHNVPASAVLSFPQALEQEQLQHRDFIVETSSPQGFDAPISVFNAPYDTSEDGPKADRPPPGIGEHCDEILAEFGFEQRQIQALRADDVIG